MEQVQVRRVFDVPNDNDQPHVAVPSLELDLQRARQLATLLDAQFEIAGVKVGMDSIVGLIPGVGDLAMAAAGLYLPYVARRHGLGRWLTARMGLNLVIDFLVGSLPVVGDVADIFYKANLKNLSLLEKATAAKLAKVAAPR